MKRLDFTPTLSPIRTLLVAFSLAVFAVAACPGGVLPDDDDTGDDDDATNDDDATGDDDDATDDDDAVDPNPFPCGRDLECDAVVEYCSAMVPGVEGPDTEYSCVAYPEECASEPDCECLLDEEAEGECTGTPRSGFTVTIYLP